MSDSFEIDLDGEQVLFDGTWYAKEELARRIKGMVDGGDYRVARPSAALEALQDALVNLRTLSVRLPAELAEALSSAAARQAIPVGAYVREALARSLPQPSRPPAPSANSQIPMLSPVTEPATAEEAASAIPLTPKRRDEGDPAKGWFNRK